MNDCITLLGWNSEQSLVRPKYNRNIKTDYIQVNQKHRYGIIFFYSEHNIAQFQNNLRKKIMLLELVQKGLNMKAQCIKWHKK